MGALTQKRGDNIRKAQKDINANTNRNIGAIEGDLEDVKLMAAWSMDQFLKGKIEDIDVADLAIMKSEYTPKSARLRSIPLLLDRIEGISVLDGDGNIDLAASRIALDQFIADYGLAGAIAQYDSDFNK